MGMKFTNFATSTLAAGITNVQTSLTVATGDGTKFPVLGAGDYFYATLENLAGTREVVKVTARTGDSFGTIVRAQDGTSAVAWNLGDKVELRLVSANVNDVPKLDEVNTFSLAQTFTTAPVFTDQAGTRTAAGAAASGANTDITSLAGTATNDNAAAGKIGEYIESAVPVGSAISLTNATVANVTSISLTAGDWEVSSAVVFHPAASTNTTGQIASPSTTSATLDGDASKSYRYINSGGYVPTQDFTGVPRRVRLSLAATTTVYLVAYAYFTVSTMGAYGTIAARRVR